ncbi:hypothetical protein [Streptomyces sp. NPDC052042]|uniref:hypothetical protein n=1 Tax=Streptomyces sp. NPDC052042 TaxID=3365683 RepID=UPI0037D4E3B0
MRVAGPAVDEAQVISKASADRITPRWVRTRPSRPPTGAGGLTLLFTVLMVLAAAVAVCAALAVPVVPPLPKARQTLADLVRRPADGVFVRLVAALSAATAALSVGVGFLPLSGRADGLPALVTGAAVSVLAACAALVQPWAGRALDEGRLTARTGVSVGLASTACALAARRTPR